MSEIRPTNRTPLTHARLAQLRREHDRCEREEGEEAADQQLWTALEDLGVPDEQIEQEFARVLQAPDEQEEEHAFTEEVSAPCAEGAGVTIDDFVAYMPQHVYIFTPCREVWPAASVNARLKKMPVLTKTGKPKKDEDGKPAMMPASTWLDQNKPVECMTWAPGFPTLIKDRLVVDGGWIERRDVTCFNHYRPPRIQLGDATKAGPWLEHIRKIYSDDADHILAWLAHRVQRPGEKINHALVLGGAQGIGKDTLLEPVRQAVGPWNFRDVVPANIMGRFNSYTKAVILRVNEARDLGDAERVNRFTFYDHTKIYTAAPPETLRVDEKHLREYYVFNVLGFLITTNHKTDGIYLPADDRRHYVAWSNFTKEDFAPDYWNTLWGWYYAGGFEHVAAYLAELDISGFDSKAPPPKTPAWWDIVSANSAPEDAELTDVIERLGNPNAVTLKQLVVAAKGEAAEWLMDRKNRRAIPHRLERRGYVAVKNPDAKDGLWKINGERQVVYAKANLSPKKALEAVRKLLGKQGA